MRGGFSFAALGELIPMSAFTSTTNLVGIAGQRGLIALISVLFGSYVVGLVSVAVRIVETLRGMINGAGVQLIHRRMALRMDDPAAMRDFYVAASQLLASLAVPTFMGIYVCAPQIVTILLQPQWLDAVEAVRLLCLAGALTSFRVFDPIVNSSLGRPQINLGLVSTALAAAVATLVALPFFGSDQAALAWPVRAVLGFALSAVMLHATSRIDYRTQARAMWPVAVAALTMTAALLALQQQLPARMSATARLAIVVPLGVAIYFAVLLPLAPATGRRLLQLARGR
jgi:O-antigen/teichoic acid export membrane protein